MKFTLGWLKEHLDTDASLEEISAKLTMIGLEVDGITDRGSKLTDFTVARVISATQHRNADRLRVCIVDTGTEEVQVVCGARNARTGLVGVFAPSGTYIPGSDMVLKPTEIRGVASEGMLCSERELEISDEHDGIIDLPADSPIGAPFAKIAGLDDPIIEVGLTPNRGDCAGVRGIARDLAAAGLGSLKRMTGWDAPVPGQFESPVKVHLDFEADTADACPAFAGRYIRGVKNGPSPKWLQDRLMAVGLRPISALVDITNFFTMDAARPLHVFDAGKLQGDITVRLAKGGEEMPALDNKTYTLQPGMTAVCDAMGPQALGGIMGGELSGCTEDTTDVFVECALFDPLRTAATGRKLGIHSDARYRFERGVDPESLVPGIEAATAMILELCGGEASETVVAGAAPEWRRSVALRPNRVETLVGIHVAEGEQVRILQALGFQPEVAGDGIKTTPPSWRPDIVGEADLVEEVSRIVGFDTIPETPLPRKANQPAPALNLGQARRVRVRRTLAGRDMVEAVTFSFLKQEDAKRFGGGDDALLLDNPISADLDCMRPSIIPNLLAAASRNFARAQRDGALFEVGPTYRDPSETGQDWSAAGLRWGSAKPRHWTGPARAVDVFDAKSDVLAALGAAGAPIETAPVEAAAEPWQHPGRSGHIRLGKNVLARFGEIHPAVLAAYDIDVPVVAFEAFLSAVPEPKRKSSGKTRSFLKLDALLPVERDFAFFVDADIPAENAVRAARLSDKKMITDVQAFDAYQGKGVDEGKKSLAIAVTFQPKDATLTDAEIDALSAKVVAAVENATGGSLRG